MQSGSQKKQEVPKIESVENRAGVNDRPYGFVYFIDGSRVGYSNNRLWSRRTQSDAWGEITEAHMVLASGILKEKKFIK